MRLENFRRLVARPFLIFLILKIPISCKVTTKPWTEPFAWDFFRKRISRTIFASSCFMDIETQKKDDEEREKKEKRTIKRDSHKILSLSSFYWEFEMTEILCPERTMAFILSPTHFSGRVVSHLFAHTKYTQKRKQIKL